MDGGVRGCIVNILAVTLYLFPFVAFLSPILGFTTSSNWMNGESSPGDKLTHHSHTHTHK